MIEFMDRFSDFFVKWFFFPIYFFYSLFLFLIAWYESFDFLTSFAFFICGMSWTCILEDFCHKLEEKHPDLEHLDDESDGK